MKTFQEKVFFVFENKNRFFIFSVAAILFLLPSCDTNHVYEKNIPIKNYTWDSGFLPSFSVEIKDTSVLYDLYVNVRHSGTYPYRNIWLMVTTQFPDSTKGSRRIEILLAGEEGKWFGEGLDDIWDYRTLIQENAFFTKPGLYQFTIEQNMRQDPLPGVMSIGVRLENTGQLKINAAGL